MTVIWVGEKPDVWMWPHFSPDELKCRGTGKLMVVPAFLDKLEALRALCGFALPVTSYYRAPEHNVRVSATGPDGPHTTARASDLSVFGERAHTVMANAFAIGFTGIGVKQHGALEKRFIHLDDLAGTSHPRPRVWSYR